MPLNITITKVEGVIGNIVKLDLSWVAHMVRQDEGWIKNIAHERNIRTPLVR